MAARMGGLRTPPSGMDATGINPISDNGVPVRKIANICGRSAGSKHDLLTLGCTYARRATGGNNAGAIIIISIIIIIIVTGHLPKAQKTQTAPLPRVVLFAVTSAHAISSSGIGDQASGIGDQGRVI